MSLRDTSITGRQSSSSHLRHARALPTRNDPSVARKKRRAKKTPFNFHRHAQATLMRNDYSVARKKNSSTSQACPSNTHAHQNPSVARNNLLNFSDMPRRHPRATILVSRETSSSTSQACPGVTHAKSPLRRAKKKAPQLLRHAQASPTRNRPCVAQKKSSSTSQACQGVTHAQ